MSSNVSQFCPYDYILNFSDSFGRVHQQRKTVPNRNGKTTHRNFIFPQAPVCCVPYAQRGSTWCYCIFHKTPERGFNDFTMLQMSTPTPPQYSRTSARSTRIYEVFYVIIIFAVLLLQVSTVTALTRFLQRVNLLVTHQFTGRI